ncbi:OmpP1/FadL family transporter [Taibaiella soli]|uniref:Aromatic hydrocarbon degradation protein n=1 Tax=Taibaiella soli TaxID=1649169 RepID=A0A2W2AIE2_9BACT|nr:hypothetical protein [Taibaiella soli]PZF73352.1 hypothetical protein DN068_08150 [Taibaiella soli]
MSSNRITKFFIAAGLLSSISFAAWAQNEIDALRYSYLSPMGTARSMGFGGALGSIGGDFTSLSVNPAGIGIYRSSEIIFTPSLKINSTNTAYTGTNGNSGSFGDSRTRFNINNAGAVFTTAQKGRRYKNSNWKSVSFGIGVNRLADFTRNYNYQGYNNTSSASEPMVVDANQNGYSYGNFQPASLAQMGYSAYLVDTGALYGANSSSYGTIVAWQQGVIQRKSVSERGGVNEMVLSFGGNYKEKLMLGATLGLPFINFYQESSITETNTLTPAQDQFFGSFNYNQYLTTHGYGINLKLGFIYKINDQFRIGGAIHTPTAYQMYDNTDYSIASDTRNLKSLVFNDNTGSISTFYAHQNFNYGLTTPWRGLLSASAMLGKIGFITADAEYVDYNSMRYHMHDYRDYEQQINTIIKNTYQGAFNFRAGAEFRFDMMMFRGGFGYYGSPYQSPYNYSGSDRFDISAGLGFRFQHAFIDIGYVHSMYSTQEQPYTLPYPNVVIPTATIKNNNNNVAITLGFKF